MRRNTPRGAWLRLSAPITVARAGSLTVTARRPQAGPARRSPEIRSGRELPPWTPMTRSSGFPPRFEVNTIASLSGDQAGSRSSASSSRVRRKGGPPSAGSRKRS